MKNSRPRIKFSQTPHSVARRIETIPNKTAAALLSLINRKTVGFGQGFVDLSYAQITGELDVHSRTLSRAAKKLESWGDIVRERVAHRIYRWKIVLCRDEIIEDPARTYVTRATTETTTSRLQGKKNGHQVSGGRSNYAHLTDHNVTSERHSNVKDGEGVLTDLSGPCGSICQDHADRSIRTKSTPIEQRECCGDQAEPLDTEQKREPLKNSLKETDLKKQQQACSQIDTVEFTESESQLAARSADEPLHKFCLRGLKKHGVRQRVARQLCREYDHELIRSVLETVPQLTGVKNVAGYLVAAIRDGGYRCTERVEERAKNQNSQYPKGTRFAASAGQKNGHQVSGGRSNYAHLTDINLQNERHRNVKAAGDAPIGYRTVEETRAENERLEAERQQRSQQYRDENRNLAEKFRDLSDDVKAALKKLSAQCLEKLLPPTGRREEMLKDLAFKRIANRSVLEQFFDWVEQGLSEEKALRRLGVSGVMI